MKNKKNNATEAYVKSSTMCVSAFAMGNVEQAKHLFPVEIFLDLANVERCLYDLGHHAANYGKLIHVVLREYARRLGMAAVTTPSSAWNMELLHSVHIPTAVCRAVWCVASVPVNFNPNDAELAERRRGFLAALQLRHGFHVEELPFNFAGNHVSKEVRKKSSVKKERDWKRPEKGVDVALVVRLMQRCLSPDPPTGVIAVSGDADFAPALRAVTCNDPTMQVMVAGFSDAMSRVYLSDGQQGYSWKWPPILLDDFLDEFECEN